MRSTLVRHREPCREKETHERGPGWQSMVAVQQERSPGGAIVSIETSGLSVTDPAAPDGPIRGWLARSRAPAALPGLCRSATDVWEHAALRPRSGNGCMRLAKAAAAAATQLPPPPLRGSLCAHRNTGVSLTVIIACGWPHMPVVNATRTPILPSPLLRWRPSRFFFTAQPQESVCSCAQGRTRRSLMP